jgi:preprotein translocase subunit SecA
MRIFGGDKISSLMDRLKVDEETPIENRLISKSLEGAQKKVEGFHFDQRKNVVQYDDVMNRHRKAIYAIRREILQATDVNKRIHIYIDEEAAELAHSSLLTSDDFEDVIRDLFGFDEKTLDRLFDTEADKFEKLLIEVANQFYSSREEAFTPDIMRKVERDVYLQILDNLWMQHLENMDHLRNGIHWISVGQRDPLVEYRRQGQQLFQEMQKTMRQDIIRALFHAQPIEESEVDKPIETDLTRAASHSINNAGQIVGNENEFDEGDFVSKKEQTQVQKDLSEKRRKARKNERKRKATGRRRK